MTYKKIPLFVKILIGMVVGVIFGYVMNYFGENKFVIQWIKPFGTIFINCLKMIAVPLIIVSLINGLADLKDISKFSKIGIRTIILYLFTTAFAITIGLIIANITNPGDYVSPEAKEKLLATFSSDASKKIELSNAQKEIGPLQFLVDIVPDNIFLAMSDNSKMMQVIFFTILVGIGLILIPEEKSKPVKAFFAGFNEVMLKIIDIIMLGSPIGVFALMAAVMVEIPDSSILKSLGIYALTVIVGILFLLVVFYPFLYTTFTKRSPKSLFKGILPAQLLAFSTSSSAATLPVTIERCIEHLGVDEEVASFVLPLGATVNMDGTALYQAVAAIFIAQVFGIDLTLSDQLMIILTATLASIGSAAVPSAGMVMLVVVLEQAGIPVAGIALIFAIDRPLDMCRTVANVTSDATVSTLVAKSLKLLKPIN